MRLFDGRDVAPRRLSLIKTSGGVGGRVDMFDSSRGGARVIRALDFVTHRHTSNPIQENSAQKKVSK